jgi:3-oxoadipate enol-lactonase
MPFATSGDGRRLNYRLDGPEGAPVVMFSNSLGTNLTVFDGQAEALKDRFRVLRYDQRGHGASDAPEGDYTMDELGRDAVAVLDAAGVARASVVGVSMGGGTAQWLGARAPDRVEKLVVANSAAVFATPQIWQDRLEAVRAGGTQAVVQSVIDRWFTPEFAAANPAEVDRIKAMLLATPSDGYAGCCAALRDADLRPGLAAIRAPTLVIAGLHDFATPVAKSEELVQAIAGARLATIDASHLSPIERPEAFTALVADFLG